MAYGYGFGFRGASPPWPYVGRGRGGLPRCWCPAGIVAPPYALGSVPYPTYGGAWTPAFYGGYPAPGGMPYPPQMTREQELDFLKEEANAVKGQLEQIEARMRDLESEE